jgi:hypothetical protein
VRARGRAAWSFVFGLLSALTLPVAVVATRYSDSYDLLHAGFAIPVALVLGIGAIVLARRARALDRASLGTTRWARVARVGRLLGILGICVAASATIAVAVYEVLLAAE